MTLSSGTVSSGTFDFYLDPMCPWAYRTSLWIREVRRQTDLEIGWRFFSLEEVNRPEGKPHPWERDWAYGWSQMRVAALLRRTSMDLVDRWYAATCDAFFEQGRPTFTPEGQADVLEAMGLERSLVAEAIADPTTADEVRADHDHVVAEFGGHGVPTLVFGDRRSSEGPSEGPRAAGPASEGPRSEGPASEGPRSEGPASEGPGPKGKAFFGPVILTPPSGEAALRLWDLVRGWLEFDDLYELRKPKTGDDMRTIGAMFSTYLDTRKWATIQNAAL